MADTQVSAVTAKFKAELGKEIVAEVKVVPELIGGFKVQVGDLVHDLSIKSQLNKLKQQVAKA
jgi:F-type H+-transporting ATPase subunit delta